MNKHYHWQIWGFLPAFTFYCALTVVTMETGWADAAAALD